VTGGKVLPSLNSALDRRLVGHERWTRRGGQEKSHCPPSPEQRNLVVLPVASQFADRPNRQDVSTRALCLWGAGSNLGRPSTLGNNVY